MGFDYQTFTIYDDNSSAVYLSKGANNNKRRTHIDIRYNFIKDLVEKGAVVVTHILGQFHKPDVLTKSLPNNCIMELCNSSSLF